MRTMPRCQWAAAVLLVAVTLLIPASAASAASNHRHLVTCVVSRNPVESTTAGTPTAVTIGGVPYTRKITIEKISEKLRVYAPSRRCTYRGRFTRISTTDTYRIETSVPVTPSGGYTDITETITISRTVSTAHAYVTSGSVSTTTQEVAPVNGIGTAYGPVSGGGATG